MYDWVLQRHADLNALRVPPYEPSGFHLVDFGKYCYLPLGRLAVFVSVDWAAEG